MLRRLFLTIFLVLGLSAAAGAEAARFSLTSSTIKQGCDGAIPIYLWTQGKETDAANIILHYNPAEIEVLDANPVMPGVQIATGSTYDIWADNVVDSGAGIIRLTGFSIGHSYNSGTGAGIYGSIPVRSKPGVTTSQITIEFRDGDTLDSNVAEYLTSDDLLTSVGDATFTFVTGPCVADTQPPAVSGISPPNGANGVPLDSEVSFRITDNQSGVDLDTLTVTIMGVTYTKNGVNRFTETGVALDYQISITPIAPFPADTLVTVRVTAQDLANNVMAPYSWSFNRPPLPPAADTQPPVVSSVQPPNGALGVPLKQQHHLSDH
ncbi:MAG: Ig-like domain-containing protein [bacterium]